MGREREGEERVEGEQSGREKMGNERGEGKGGG